VARTPHEKRRALIAGAGIGGLTAALALSRAGFLVDVFERAPALEEVGAGIQIPPNASGILADLGVLHRLEHKALEPDCLRVRSGATGSVLMTMPLGREARLRWDNPMLVAHRADLQAALLDAVSQDINIHVELGATITGVDLSKSSVTLRTQTMQETGDLLVGADGAHSLVRRAAGLGSGKAGYSGRVAWRALVPSSEAPAFARAKETALWLGPKTHLVHYPLRGGSLINIVAITDDEWRGDDENFWSSQGDARDLMRAFRDWDTSARKLLESASEWRRWPLLDAEPLQRWSVGPVTLLGDAAHPMLPFFAQGAAQSIEDAAALGAAFMPRNWQEVSVTRGFADYERKRRARATRIQSASRKQGMIYHLAGPAALIRDMGMRALPPDIVMARFDWLYEDQRGAFFT
jgi:salicylate hydroxylase